MMVGIVSLTELIIVNVVIVLYRTVWTIGSVRKNPPRGGGVYILAPEGQNIYTTTVLRYTMFQKLTGPFTVYKFTVYMLRCTKICGFIVWSFIV